MNKGYIIAIVIIAALLIGGGIYLYASQSTATPYQQPAPAADTPTPAPTPSPAAVPTTHNVSIQNFSFDQASITIKQGDTIIWTNLDSASHTVVGDNGGPSSPAIATNGTYSYTFNNIGTFNYHCSIHPSMKGTVVVTQ